MKQVCISACQSSVRNKLPTKCIFRIFPILRTGGMAPFLRATAYNAIARICCLLYTSPSPRD